MSNTNEQRAYEVIKIIQTGEVSEFSSVNNLIDFLQPKLNVGPRTIRLAINLAEKKGWLKKKERQTFGGPMPIYLSDKLPSPINQPKKTRKKEVPKLVEHKDLGFAKIAQLFIAKVEETLADQDVKINQQKQQIGDLKEIVESIQITPNKIDQISERFDKIEKEISEGTQILVDAFNTLKGK